MSYLLRFRLHTDAPSKIKKRYEKVYEDIVIREKVTLYLNYWIWKLEGDEIGKLSDRQLLDRCEGGIGGDSNKTDRQIRFHNEMERMSCGRTFGEITLLSIPSDDGTETWTPEELKQFGEAFSEMLNDQIGTSGAIDFYVALFYV